MIHVCYGLYDKTGHYSKFTGTSMLSIFENTAAEVTVHILHDNTLTQENINNFIYIAGRYKQNVKFYNVEKICADKIQFLRDNLSKYINSRFSIGAFYRLLVNKKFFQPDNVQKIIYLDADTIVNLDIAELWNYPLQNYTVAAVPEMLATYNHMIMNKYLITSGKVNTNDYFCSGIMTLDLNRINENFFNEGVQWLAENLQCASPDQDILNNYFANSYCKLPEKYDAFVLALRIIKNTTISDKIYHYAGNTAITFDMKEPYNRLFFNYFAKTPWFNFELIGSAYEFAQNMYNEHRKFVMQLSKILPGNERAFLTSKDNENAMRIIFEVTDAEEVIISDDDGYFEKLVESMKNSQGKKIFFIISSNYSNLKTQLNNAGFTDNKDFVNALEFLSENQGTPFETYPFLKAL